MSHRSSFEATVTVGGSLEATSQHILVSGRQAINRALDGDTVAGKRMCAGQAAWEQVPCTAQALMRSVMGHAQSKPLLAKRWYCCQ